MSTEQLPAPPEGLQEAGRDFWTKVVAEFEFSEPHHLELLRQACIALGRIEEAKEVVDELGLVVEDRYGSLKTNPAAEQELKYQRMFRNLLRELQLDIEPEDDGYSRPPRLTDFSRVRQRGAN